MIYLPSYLSKNANRNFTTKIGVFVLYDIILFWFTWDIYRILLILDCCHQIRKYCWKCCLVLQTFEIFLTFPGTGKRNSLPDQLIMKARFRCKNRKQWWGVNPCVDILLHSLRAPGQDQTIQAPGGTVQMCSPSSLVSHCKALQPTAGNTFQVYQAADHLETK